MSTGPRPDSPVAENAAARRRARERREQCATYPGHEPGTCWECDDQRTQAAASIFLATVLAERPRPRGRTEFNPFTVFPKGA